MYKALIFDFFDVIHRDPFQHWLKLHGLTRSGAFEKSSDLLDVGEIDDDEFYRQLGEASGQAPEQIEAIFADTTLIDSAVVDLIKRLKPNYQIGLLSNSSIKYIWDIIDQHGIASLFDVITVSAEVGLMKPDPRIFEHILNKLDVKPYETIFVDDNPKNVAAAATLGIQAITFKGREDLLQQLAKLDVLSA